VGGQARKIRLNDTGKCAYCVPKDPAARCETSTLNSPHGRVRRGRERNGVIFLFRLERNSHLMFRNGRHKVK
jgi:hypothetical protein